MSTNKNNIDKLFQQKLKGHQVKAPSTAWSKLSGDLHQPANTRFFWLSRSAAAVILLLIAFGAGYYFSELNRNADPAIADNSPAPKNEISKTNQTPSIENLIDEQDFESTDDGINPSVESGQMVSVDEKSSKTSMPPEDIGSDITANLIAESKIEESEIAFEDSEAKTPTALKGVVETFGHTDISQEDIALNKIESKEITKTESDEIPRDDVPVMTEEMLRNMLFDGEDDLAEDIINRNSDIGSSKWIIGGRISPVFSYRSLSGGDFSTPNESLDAGYFDSNEEGITTIAGGISLDYQFNDRLSLGSGMYLSRIGQQNNDVLAFNDSETGDMFKLATSTGTVTVNPASFESVIARQVDSPKDSIPGDYIVNGSFVQNLDYLEVPLVLKYKVIDSKLSVNVMGGLSPGILVNNRSYFSTEGEKLQTGTTENINPFIYNSIVGLGLEYTVSRKVAISMEPSFKYALSPVNSGSDLRYHPYSLSWFTGISYKLD